MSAPMVPQQAGPDGRSMGARQPPSCCAKCCLPACAISGYETGDPTDGCCGGKALAALLLQLGCGMGWIISFCCWSPDPQKIRGDATQRTVNNRCFSSWCAGGPCTISFWESGDLCDGLCNGDACCATCLWFLIFVPFIGELPWSAFYACCCWDPDVGNFKRTREMHGAGCYVGQVVKIGNGAV
ncbi:unnamed protein product [Polarella glacialis]|uniref:Uncharacterized protein n=1 Tax=Polarella glacialis TaxID=89957 RepID=A0A813M021_POLGL|nr:unnamed protein product [Polarella glacialis]